MRLPNPTFLLALLALVGCTDPAEPTYTGPLNPPPPTKTIGALGRITGVPNAYGEGTLINFRDQDIIIATVNDAARTALPQKLRLENTEGQTSLDNNPSTQKAITTSTDRTRDLLVFSVFQRSPRMPPLRLAFTPPAKGQPVWLLNASGQLFRAQITRCLPNLEVTFTDSPDGSGGKGTPYLDSNGDIVGFHLQEIQTQEGVYGKGVPLHLVTKLLD